MPLKIIPELEKNPKVLNFAQTFLGKFLIWLIFSLAFYLLQFDQNHIYQAGKGFIWDKILIFGLFLIFPQYKKLLLVVASLYWFQLHTFDKWNLSTQAMQSLQSLLLSFIVIAVLTKILHKTSFKTFIPIVILNLALAFTDLNNQIVSGCVIIIAQFFWYWLFLIKDAKFRYWQILTFIPFWTWTTLPYPKGWQYLNQTEAKDDLALAISRLKGLKLISWALCLAFVHVLFSSYVYGQNTFLTNFLFLQPKMLIMELHTAVHLFLSGNSIGLVSNWLSVVAAFLHTVLYLAIGSHVIVAIIRLCGWQVKRNVYKCLYATSISDFFNKFYYYFKELLVEMFFYPTYFSCFKNYATIRLFFATVMAAGVGNFLFHFFLDASSIVKNGYLTALSNHQAYALYCLILSLGIFVSQWARINKKFQQNIWLVRTRIFIFFMLLNILVSVHGITITQYLNFLAGLVGT